MFGFTPLRRTYEAAVRDLRSPKQAVRAAAAHDLGLVGDTNPREAADALAPLLDDTWSDVRAAALTAIGTLRARHLTERLAALLDDGDSNVRQLAAVALAESGGERALELLKRALSHERADVRFQSLLGVLSLDVAEGHRAALAALESDDPWIASEAAEQLGRLFALDPDQRIANNLPTSDRAQTRALLRERLGDPSDRVALAAVIALARMGEADMFPALCDFVRDRNRLDGADREALVLEALELLGDATGESAAPARETLSFVASRLLPSPRRAVARRVLARIQENRP